LGCEFFEDNPSPEAETPPEYIPLSTLLPGSHLTPGLTLYERPGVYILVTPGMYWTEAAIQNPLYIIQSNRVWQFQALAFDTIYGGLGLKVLPVGWSGYLPNGFVFWREGAVNSLYSPTSANYDARALRRALVEALEDWGDSLIVQNRIELYQLGATESILLFWVAEIPENDITTYSADSSAWRSGPLGFDGEAAWLEHTFTAPCGYNLEYLHAADVCGDGVADLVNIPLRGEGAPVRSYFYNGVDRWYWVGEFFLQ